MSFEFAPGKAMATPDEVGRVARWLEGNFTVAELRAVANGDIGDIRAQAATMLRSLAKDHSTAINALQDIAAMGRKAGSETARHTLCQLGIDVPDYDRMT
jgi:hypothetical protein